MATDNHNLLREAIARNAAITLALPSAGMLREYRSRFLGGDEEGFRVESIPGERPLVDELVRNQTPTGVLFKSGGKPFELYTPALRRESGFRVNVGTLVEALLLAHPEEPGQIKSIQRRNHYRVRLWDGCGLAARVWRIAAKASLAAVPVAAVELNVAVRDISVGGLGVAIRPASAGEPIKVSSDDRLRVEVRFRDSVLLLEAQMRPAIEMASAEMAKTGIYFKFLQDDLLGRRKLAQLTRIVGELQREEVRRTRLGLARFD